ncbi:MAG: hypothetical protein N2749_06645 [Clostridia bacterium]|nr:hypothetical protein [Clostridia bacterium]
MEEKQNNLYIPANIKTRLEFFKGYGIKELVATITVVAFFMPIIYLIYLLKGILVAIIVFLVFIAGTVIANTKDDNNLCIVEQLRFMIRKSKMQKLYKYKHYDKWRG